MTQPASEKKRREARAVGQVVSSPLVPAAAALAAGALTTWLTARGAGVRLAELARRAFSQELPVDGAVTEALLTIARVALPVAGAAWLAAAVAGAAHTRGLFTLGAFGRRGAEDETGLPPVAWGLSLAHALTAVLTARPAARALASAQGIAAASMALLDTLRVFVPRALALVAAAAFGDWAWRRLRLERALAMTRGELERERREEEGDPRLGAERRRRHRALAAEDPRPKPAPTDDKT